MVRRARLIYNPSSGREEMRRRLPDILDRLERGGLETSCHETKGTRDATIAAEEAIRRGFDVVIAAGGDGTIYEVVNGLAERENRPQLGILPVGTTNDFARALGIPRHWEQAVDIIVRQETMEIDLGRVEMANETKYFINIAGGGSLTELTYEVPSKLKTMLGQLAYYMKGIEKLAWLRPIQIEMRSDDCYVNEEIMMFLLANSCSVAGFEKLAPEASLHDGKLDLIVLRKCNLADFIRLASMALRGEHLNDPFVRYYRVDELSVTSSDHVQLNLDGELGGELPSRFSVLPKHLEIFVDSHAVKEPIVAAAAEEYGS
jgi:diacylglycerol kinase (ATP)